MRRVSVCRIPVTKTKVFHRVLFFFFFILCALIIHPFVDSARLLLLSVFGMRSKKKGLILHIFFLLCCCFVFVAVVNNSKKKMVIANNNVDNKLCPMDVTWAYWILSIQASNMMIISHWKEKKDKRKRIGQVQEEIYVPHQTMAA